MYISEYRGIHGFTTVQDSRLQFTEKLLVNPIHEVLCMMLRRMIVHVYQLYASNTFTVNLDKMTHPVFFYYSYNNLVTYI
jgi:hypothetical protein